MNTHNPDDFSAVERLLTEADFSAASRQRDRLRVKWLRGVAQHQPRRLAGRRAWAALAAIALIASFAISAPLRSLAQDVWRFFARAEENTQPVEQALTGHILFTQTSYWLEPAQAATGFQIKQPPAQHFRLASVSYAPLQGDAVMLDYDARTDNATGQIHYQGIFGLWIDEVWVGETDMALTGLDEIGPTAEVESVQIGTIPGEYVFGQWTTPDPEGDTLTWTEEHFHQLRWIADGVYYKMVAATFPAATPDISPDDVRDTMITLAASLE